MTLRLNVSIANGNEVIIKYLWEKILFTEGDIYKN